MSIIKKTNKIQVICPICKTRDLVGIPRSSLNINSQLTTISIQKGLICPHHFQFFMDNQFQIRGYQKVDLELNQENSNKLRNGVKALNQSDVEKSNLFEKLIYDGNKVKYVPVNSDINNENKIAKQKTNPKNKIMTLKEIYDEFWEFIDEDNSQFQKFIIMDNRRKKLGASFQMDRFKDQLEIQSL